MLFTIGLKLKMKDLAETPVWLGSTIHMALTVACFLPILMVGGSFGLTSRGFNLGKRSDHGLHLLSRAPFLPL